MVSLGIQSHIPFAGESESNFFAITSNDHSFRCPIIYTDTYSQCHFFHWHPNNGWYRQAYSLIVTPYFTIIASNVLLCEIIYIASFGYKSVLLRTELKIAFFASAENGFSKRSFGLFTISKVLNHTAGSSVNSAFSRRLGNYDWET